MIDESSPLCAAVKEANIPTLVDHLQEYLTHPDVVERMKPLQTACDGLLRALSGFCKQIGAVVQRVAESPPSPGYEPWLIERGSNPILARMIAGLLVRIGNRSAEESRRASGSRSRNPIPRKTRPQEASDLWQRPRSACS